MFFLTANTVLEFSKKKAIKAFYYLSSSLNLPWILQKNISFAYQSTSVIMLVVKPNQNLIIDLDASRYNTQIRPLIEYLKYSPLMKALTMSKYAPLLSTTKFEVSNYKTSITKPNFCKFLEHVLLDVNVDPESIPTTSLIDMFYQMGYNGDISLLSKFRKPFLPLLWNGLFTLLFKSLSGRIYGSNSASKLFYTLIYGLYHASILTMGMFFGLNSFKAPVPPLTR